MRRHRGWILATLTTFIGGVATANPPAPPPTPVGGAIGASGPLVVEGYAPDRRWVALCQAREDTDGDGEMGVSVGYHGDTFGDALKPYLVVGDGPGRPIDAFVDASTDGRWVALVEAGRLILWDSVADRRLDLSTRGAVTPATTHALFPGYGAFAWRSHRFLYFRDVPEPRRAKPGERPRRVAVVIDADRGSEWVIDHGDGDLFSAYLHEGGRHATVFVAPADQAIFLPRTSLARGGCRGPITSYSTGGASNLQARFVRVVGPAWSGRHLAILGGRALVRTEAGALVWDEGGRRSPALPAELDGRVLAVSRGGAIVLCVPAPADAESCDVRLVSPGGRTSATPWSRELPDDDYSVLTERVWMRWGEDRLTWLLDTETGAHMTAPFESDLEGVSGAKAFLMRRSDGWAAIADLATGKVTDLPITTSPYETHGRYGDWAFARLSDGGNVVVDVTAGRVAGFVGGPEAVGLSADGLLLTAARVPGLVVRNRLPEGPLRWYRPGTLEDGPR